MYRRFLGQIEKSSDDGFGASTKVQAKISLNQSQLRLTFSKLA